MHDNKLEFNIDDGYSIDYVELTHSIKDGKKFGKVYMEDRNTLVVESDRKASDGVATKFKEYIGGALHCTACMSNDTFPNDLNFAVNGTFTITTDNGEKYSNTVAVAQGCNFERRNNWWIGGEKMLGKAVGTPSAIGLFRRSDIGSIEEQKIDQTIKAISNAVSDSIQGIFDKIAETINNDPDNAKANIQSKIDDVAKKIGELIDNSSLSQLVKDNAKQFVNALAEMLKKQTDKVMTKSSDIANKIIELGEAVANKINSLLTDTASKINKELHQIISQIISVVSVLVMRIDGSTSSPNIFTMTPIKVTNIE